MTKTVVGVFDTPDAARAAEERLVRRGIGEAAIHLAAQENAYVGSAASRPGGGRGGASGIRNFFSELFGTEHSDEVEHYSEAVRRGGVLLAVDVPEGTDIEPVREALLDAGAMDIDERVEYWRRQGWTGYNPEAAPYSADEVSRERSAVLPESREETAAGRREIAPGSVRIYGRTVESPLAQEGLRFGEADQGGIGTEGYAGLRPYEDYEPDFRRDYRTRYGTLAGSFDDYAPAYRYGHNLAGDPRYQGRGWAEVEPEARRDWEQQYPESTWERFKLAIQHGWERVTGRS